MCAPVETQVVQLTCMLSGGDSGHSWCTVWFKTLQTGAAEFMSSSEEGFKELICDHKVPEIHVLSKCMISDTRCRQTCRWRTWPFGCRSARQYVGSSPSQTSSDYVTEPAVFHMTSGKSVCLCTLICVREKFLILCYVLFASLQFRLNQFYSILSVLLQLVLLLLVCLNIPNPIQMPVMGKVFCVSSTIWI